MTKQDWIRLCIAVTRLINEAKDECVGDLAINAARGLLAEAYQLKNIACLACGGSGKTFKHIEKQIINFENTEDWLHAFTMFHSSTSVFSAMSPMRGN